MNSDVVIGDNLTTCVQIEMVPKSDSAYFMEDANGLPPIQMTTITVGHDDVEEVICSPHLLNDDKPHMSSKHIESNNCIAAIEGGDNNSINCLKNDPNNHRLSTTQQYDPSFLVKKENNVTGLGTTSAMATMFSGDRNVREVL